MLGLDVHGPADVFTLARHWADQPYRVTLTSTTGEPVVTTAGIRITPDGSLAALSAPADTVIVAGGPGAEEAARDERLLRWLRAVAPQTRRIGAVCSGALVLAAAGLLDGRRAATHWSVAETLARRNAAVTVDPGVTYVIDGSVFTSAGVTAAIDLALALVEADHGRAVAMEIARVLVMPQRRGGAQPQLSSLLALQHAGSSPLQALAEWLSDHLGEDLRVEALARRLAMSPRHFSRLWCDATGTSPAASVRRLRAERARVLLETTGLTLGEIARECGFRSADVLRRAVRAEFDVRPSDLRPGGGAAQVRSRRDAHAVRS